ncbi:glycosyltransferase family 2 protein [Candidatus Omnitrophota bacterium]
MISIVIASHKKTEDLDRCLESVFSQRPRDTEVIVVGNAFSFGDSDLFRKQYPGAILIINTDNKGSACARNQGIRLAKGEYIMFLDSDAYLCNNFFDNLENVLKKAPSHVGAIAPKILNADSRKVFSCGLRISPLYRVHDVGANEDGDALSRTLQIDGPNSCCAIFKRACLESIKDGEEYFDEDFFFLFEDADLARRLKEEGCDSLFVPELICYHYGGGSNMPQDFRRYLCFRNRLYMIMKIKDRQKRLSVFAKSFLYDFLRTLHFFLTNKYFTVAVRDICKKAKHEKNTDF